MKSKETIKLTPTAEDYAQGRHHMWEVKAHIQAASYYNEHGEEWSMEDRRTWLQRFMTSTPYTDQMRVAVCPVCSDAIAEAIISGKSVWSVPEAVKAKLKSMAAYLSPLARKRMRDQDLDNYGKEGGSTPRKYTSPSPDVMTDLPGPASEVSREGD